MPHQQLDLFDRIKLCAVYCYTSSESCFVLHVQNLSLTNAVFENAEIFTAEQSYPLGLNNWSVLSGHLVAVPRVRSGLCCSRGKAVKPYPCLPVLQFSLLCPAKYPRDSTHERVLR